MHVDTQAKASFYAHIPKHEYTYLYHILTENREGLFDQKALAIYSLGRPEIWGIMLNLGLQLDWLWRQQRETSLDSCVEGLPGKINKEKKTRLPWRAEVSTYQLQPR